jgi:hypothetical protein
MSKHDFEHLYSGDKPKPGIGVTLTQEDIDDTHNGFTVTCQRCGSTRVIVKNDLGWSEASGQWGSIDLCCLDCSRYSTIYGD